MLHAGTKIKLNDKINSRGNREQHHSLQGWGGVLPRVQRKGTWVSNNSHVTAKTGCTHNFYEFY